LRYSIDTSALMDGWRRYYPPDIFPTVWRRIDDLVSNGDLIASEEVLAELQRKDDDVYAWAKDHNGMFVLIDRTIQVEVASILQTHPRLVDTRKNRSQADPFVIATARVHGCAVVTGEKATGTIQKPNIPDVCAALGVECLDLLTVFRRQGWQV
jgi:hypothetical protein